MKNIDYYRYKINAIVIGLVLLGLPSFILKWLLKGQKNKTLEGVCVDNGVGDADNILAFKSQIARINYDDITKASQFADFAYINNIDYFVLVGRPELSDDENDDLIREAKLLFSNKTKKPLFYALFNEVNELTYEHYNTIINHVDSDINYNQEHFVKGADTAITEHGALQAYFDYFNGDKQFKLTQYHLIHFYLQYHDGKLTTRFNNTIRKALLLYILLKLKNLGQNTSTIVIDESHDGSTTLPGFPAENDEVYASKEGWEDLSSFANKVGVHSLLYYAAPFLSYKGNTVLGARNGQ